MKSPTRFFTLLLLICMVVQFHCTNVLVAQSFDNRNFVILEPTDSVFNDLPILQEKSPLDTISKVVYKLAKESAMELSIRLNQRIQNFLVNKRIQEKSEPAYLLLSQYQGGFPRHGFYLLQGDSLINKTQVSYVELVKNDPGTEDQLGSMTQIYPHEMGHVFYHLLSADSDSIVPGATDIHYSTLVTDYRTAFNEGFAMHFENLARACEPDQNRKKRILEDYKQQKKKVSQRIGPFTRDFTWPLRMGLYRATMVLWYQDFEDIKRFEWVNENRVKYRNESHIFSNAEKSLYYRNAGIGTTDEVKSMQQMCSTEGMVASFITKLINSDLQYMNADTAILSVFSKPGSSMEEIISNLDPFENQYIKIFQVLNKYVNQSLTSKSQILDFIEGYRKEFPDEGPVIDSIFLDWSGHSYPFEPGPELWITNQHHEHGIIVMDQFGGITMPYYTFNLNAATEADLLTFSEIDKKSATSIIQFIDQKGPLKSLDELDNIPGVSEKSSFVLQKNKFDPAFFENFDDYKLDLTISSLLNTALLHLLKWFFIWFVILLLLTIITYRPILNVSFTFKNAIYLFLRFLGFFIAALLALVLTTQTQAWFISFGLVFLGLQYLVSKNKENVVARLMGTIFIIAVFLFSLI